jgi:hypothetical protein
VGKVNLAACLERGERLPGFVKDGRLFDALSSSVLHKTLFLGTSQLVLQPVAVAALT